MAIQATTISEANHFGCIEATAVLCCSRICSASFAIVCTMAGAEPIVSRALRFRLRPGTFLQSHQSFPESKGWQQTLASNILGCQVSFSRWSAEDRAVAASARRCPPADTPSNLRSQTQLSLHQPPFL